MHISEYFWISICRITLEWYPKNHNSYSSESKIEASKYFSFQTEVRSDIVTNCFEPAEYGPLPLPDDTWINEATTD